MSEEDPKTQLPLRSLRVVDLGDAVGEAAARLLADLGAETIKAEPPGGAPTRHERPIVDGHSLPFLVRNANKSGTVVDLGSAKGRRAAVDLLASADLAFVTREAAELLDVDALGATHPHLVVVVSSPFGRTGPRADWQATERTFLALSGSLSRSGRPGATPLLPPEGLSLATASTQAAWTGLVALLSRNRTGTGQVINLSHHEAIAIGLDPAFGVQGSAAAGRSGKVRRDRPPSDSYPVYPCADGFVRLCLLARRQWRGMFGWLGEPDEFADSKYDSISARVADSARLNELIVALFAQHTGAALVEEAARRGVPLAQVLTLGQAIRSEHFTDAGTVVDTDLAPSLTAAVPVGCVEVDGERLGIRTPAPALGADNPPVPRTVAPPATGDGAALPFDGLRVLDLGVIVFGAEVGRAFADLGADVIKVENAAFPDGLRQTRRGEAMNASFAWGQRNKRSMGLDLRNDEGKQTFLELVAQSDVVLSNFKPGTLASLGIDHATLSAINSRIIVLESAAFSSKGPWARRLGYGPLVRAACGLSSLWRYQPEDTDCWDGVTVFPDHVAAKVSALAVAATLWAREESGQGARIEVGQSDVVLHQLAAHAAFESLSPGSVVAAGNRGHEPFGGVFACAGDDEWCVVEARTEEEVDVLRAVVGDDLDVSAWAATRSPDEVMEHLQARGIPAAAMLRLPELLDDPQLAHRGTYTKMRHPALDHVLPAENPAAPYSSLAHVDLRPAPAVAEHTNEICSEVLGMDDHRRLGLLESGALTQAPS